MKIYFTLLCLIINAVVADATTQTSVNQDKPPRLYVKSYHMSDNGSVTIDYYTGARESGGEWDITFNGTINWEEGVAGSGFWTSHDFAIPNTGIGSYTYDNDVSWSWPSNVWPNITGTMIQTFYHDGIIQSGYPVISGTPAPIIWQNGDVNIFTNYVVYGGLITEIGTTERRSTQTTIKLQTGGKAVPQSKNLFRLTASAAQTSPSGGIGGSAIEGGYYYMYGNLVGPGIPPQSMSIGSYGNLNKNGIKYIALDNGADVDVTPSVANVDYYQFSESQTEVQTKADWQQVVQYEIDNDSGVQVENYLAGNGFTTNRLNIQAVYAFYQKVFDEQPTWYYWAGLAKLAGAPVYAGLSDAEYCRIGSITSGYLTLDNLGATIASALLESKATQFQNDLIGMNIDIYSDIDWQFEAYRKCGLSALEEVNTEDSQALNIDAWREIDKGIQDNNDEKIQEGNTILAQWEQNVVLADDYVNLSGLFPGTTSLMSILAQNPVVGGPDFSSLEPGKNIANYSDRWDWISRAYVSPQNSGIFPLWLQESSSSRLGDVGQSLLYRAQNDFSLAYELFGLTIY